MEAEKRKPRAYKIADKHYNKAMRRAKKEKKHIANMVETMIVAYANGFEVRLVKQDKDGKINALDVFSDNPNDRKGIWL